MVSIDKSPYQKKCICALVNQPNSIRNDLMKLLFYFILFYFNSFYFILSKQNVIFHPSVRKWWNAWCCDIYAQRRRNRFRRLLQLRNLTERDEIWPGCLCLCLPQHKSLERTMVWTAGMDDTNTGRYKMFLEGKFNRWTPLFKTSDVKWSRTLLLVGTQS